MSRHIEVIAIAENRPMLGSDSDESLEEGPPVCREVQAAGATRRDVQAAGVSRRDVQDTRRFCREVPNERPPCKEVQDEGTSRREVQGTRRFCREVPNGRPPCQEVQDEGTSGQEVQDEGTSGPDVQDAGPSGPDVQDAGVSHRDVQAAGVSRRDVQDTRRREVPNGRPPCQEFQDAGPSVQEVQDEGTSGPDVQDAGPSGRDVQDAGPSGRDVQDAGPSRREQLQMEVHQPPPSPSFWAAFKSVLSDKKVVSAAHWLLTIIVIILLSAAMLDPWRHFAVDREALLELWRTGRIDGAVINSSLSFSRTQGVLLECYADTPRVTENDTIFFPQRGCYSVMADSALSGSNTLLVVISVFMLVGVLFFPVILFLAFCSFFFLGAAACNSPVQRRLTLRFTSGVRLLNSIFCIGFLIPAVVVGHLFQTQDPAFPMHWPQEVRDNTEVTLVGSGVVEWIFGTFFQFIAMSIDMFRARVRLSCEALG